MPVSVPCAICGKEFTESSIGIHRIQCARKRDCQGLQKPLEQHQLPADAVEDEFAFPEDDNYDMLEPLATKQVSLQVVDDSDSVNIASARQPQILSKPSSNAPLQKDVSNDACSQGPQRNETKVCHICGRQFCASVLAIHLRQCEKKQQFAQDLHRGSEASTAPNVVVNLDLAKSDSMLVHLGSRLRARTSETEWVERFTRDSSTPRRRSPTEQGRESTASIIYLSDVDTQMPSRRQTPLCYICGREFGVGTIDVHMTYCRKKWEATEAQKPLEKRRSLPPPPQTNTTTSRDDTIEHLFSDHADFQICTNCGKPLLTEVMEAHQKHCIAKTRVSDAPSKASLSQSCEVAATADNLLVRRRRRHSSRCSQGSARRSASLEFSTKMSSWECPKMQKSVSFVHPDALPHRRSNHTINVEQNLTNEFFDGSGTRVPTVACHICAREFGRKSIDIHLKQCEKKALSRQEQRTQCEREWTDLGN